MKKKGDEHPLRSIRVFAIIHEHVHTYVFVHVKLNR